MHAEEMEKEEQGEESTRSVSILTPAELKV